MDAEKKKNRKGKKKRHAGLSPSCRWAKPWPRATATRAIRHGRLSSKGQTGMQPHFVTPWNAVTSHTVLQSSEKSHCREKNTISWWWEMQWPSLKMRVQQWGGSDPVRSIQLVGMVTGRSWVLQLWGVSGWPEHCSYSRSWVQFHWWCMVQQIRFSAQKRQIPSCSHKKKACKAACSHTYMSIKYYQHEGRWNFPRFCMTRMIKLKQMTTGNFSP